ncbi:hypothetical protein IQ272_06645 [Chroococcidiopsidales cyanobacterium LEGE 13417]|uniref:hypothetical protein n=1 Tax=Chroococcidiopsis sp. CCALA 051 TaxID=869949 RepID=UPI0011B1F984|nr:hypothetical protein [Chroococcidiopsis sp. CCALA 051]MBE9015820.1 hypothetical protein [Chroococcidiopsidales cyanobacterium LEGE 13417]
MSRSKQAYRSERSFVNHWLTVSLPLPIPKAEVYILCRKHISLSLPLVDKLIAASFPFLWQDYLSEYNLREG